MDAFLASGAAGAVSASAAFASWAVRGRASNVFAPSVWRGRSDVPSIALTFDDGPSEGTLRLIDILNRHGAPATFFQCGANVKRLPEIARSVLAAGHVIGNHSQTHPRFYLRSAKFVEEEIRTAQQTIEQHTGTTPKWLRAPFGARWFGVGRAQQQLGLTGVMWTVIGYDWKLTPDAIVDRVSRNVANGAILCLHDGRETRVGPDIGATVEAVRRLLPLLLDRGYKFETLSRLLCPMK